MKTLKIDPEFRDKVPPMTETEKKTLEENIVSDGRVLVPLVVWNGVIIDGHNRYDIVQKHPEIPFGVVEREFADRYEAIVWICRNQLGRRNLTDEQKTYLIGKQYEAQKQTQAFKGNQYTKSGGTENQHHHKKIRTVDKVAKEHNVAPDTVQKAEKFAKGVDEVEEALPGAKSKILSGSVDIPKSVVAQIPRMEEEEKQNLIAMISTGKYEKPSTSRNPAGFDKEARSNKAQIDAIVADMYDPSTVPEYTIDFLVEDIQANAESYIQMLKNTLMDRSVLLTEENRPVIAQAIQKYVLDEIKKIKELIM